MTISNYYYIHFLHAVIVWTLHFVSRRKFRVNTQSHQKINKNFVKTAEDYNDHNNVNKQLVRFHVLLLLYHMCSCVCVIKSAVNTLSFQVLSITPKKLRIRILIHYNYLALRKWTEKNNIPWWVCALWYKKTFKKLSTEIIFSFVILRK